MNETTEAHTVKPGTLGVVTTYGGALNHPPVGAECIVLRCDVAPRDTYWGVKAGDVWVTIAWDIQHERARVVPVPIGWLSFGETETPPPITKEG